MPNVSGSSSMNGTLASQGWEHIKAEPSEFAASQSRRNSWGDITPKHEITPTRPDYSGTPPPPSPPKSATPNPHAALSWTACYDDGCNTHLGEKQGAGWYPKKLRKPR